MSDNDKCTKCGASLEYLWASTPEGERMCLACFDRTYKQVQLGLFGDDDKVVSKKIPTEIVARNLQVSMFGVQDFHAKITAPKPKKDVLRLQRQSVSEQEREELMRERMKRMEDGDA